MCFLRGFVNSFFFYISLSLLCQVTCQPSSGSTSGSTPSRKTQTSGPKVRKSVSSRIHEAVKAIALCHNVTPVYESHTGVNRETESAEADQDFSDENRTYQASSPDEVNSRHIGNVCICIVTLHFKDYNQEIDVFVATFVEKHLCVMLITFVTDYIVLDYHFPCSKANI